MLNGGPAATPEALMRSRYAAYVLGQVDHILDTLHPDHREDVDRTATETWSKEATWNGLRILATDGGGEAEEKGTVEFKADFELRGMRQVHHERARFERKDGRWYYVDGDLIAPEPITRVGPRTGRNDPCPCGSGKKYKKCHGKAA